MVNKAFLAGMQRILVLAFQGNSSCPSSQSRRQKIAHSCLDQDYNFTDLRNATFISALALVEDLGL